MRKTRFHIPACGLSLFGMAPGVTLHGHVVAGLPLALLLLAPTATLIAADPPKQQARPQPGRGGRSSRGKVEQFQINSKDTQRFNTGIDRDEFGVPDPDNPKTLIVKTRNIDYVRTITVYIPAQYVPGRPALAPVLEAKGYAYQYVFCLNSGHGVSNARSQILPNALEWLWKGYEPSGR